jgi:PST family polysaccharide transporter
MPLATNVCDKGEELKHEGFPPSPPHSPKILKGGAYLAARYGLGVLVGIGNMLVLTWWIGPHAYGVFVTAIGLVAFLSNLSRVGVDTYLVRMEETPSSLSYNVCATVTVTASAVLVLGALAVEPLLVRWYGSREFVLPFVVSLVCVPLSGITGIPMSKLERALDFRSIAGVELGGQCLGLAVAASLAWLRCGVWAPVAGQIAWQAFTLIATCRAAEMIPGFAWNSKVAKKALSYGVGLTASLRIWQFRGLINPLLVGRYGGPEAVAFVALALRIAEALGTVRLAAGRIAIAALARLQNNRAQFCSALEKGLLLQLVTLGPLLCGFALAGPFTVRHFLGARWTPSLEIYPFVALGVLVNSVYNLQASALFVLGHQYVVLRAYLAHVVVLGTVTAVLLPTHGIAGYGWAELLACGAYAVIHCGLTKSASIPYRRLAPALAGFSIVLFLPHLLSLVSA